MGRLPGFDYKRPFFYMVTLKRVARGRGQLQNGEGPRGREALQAQRGQRQGQVLPGGASAPLCCCPQTRATAKPLPFCAISEDGRVVANAITEAFAAVIRAWASFWRSVESVLPYVIMPDHLHLLIKLAAVENAVSLAVVVGDLRKRLNRAYWEAVLGDVARRRGQRQNEEGHREPQQAQSGQLQNGDGPCGCEALQNQREALQNQVLPGGASAPPIFESEWHDWIVKKEGQLAAFRKYILENPPRYAFRRANRQFFTRAREIVFRGTRYWAYGNESLLEHPVIVAIKGHRKGVAAVDAAPCKTSALPMNTAGLMAAAARIGPGGAGLSTFLSPLEKAAGNEIIKAGGDLIILSMTGFGERWHPSEKQERLCAAGRMLYLSPYEPQSAQLSKKEMYIRAHALADWALVHSHERLEAWP